MSQPTDTILLDEAIQIAGQVGFAVHREYLDGVGGAEPSRAAGQSCIMLDQQQLASESLARLVRILESNSTQLPDMSPELRGLFRSRPNKAA